MSTNPFEDLADDLPFGDEPAPEAFDPAKHAAPKFASAVVAPSYKQACAKCGGRGKFVSMYGRVIGDCFACGGSGFREFKTSPEARERNRTSAAARRERAAADAWGAFAEDFPTESAWIDAKRASFEFAGSMYEAVQRWGRLTDGQLAAVRRCIDRDAERGERRAQAAATAVDFHEAHAGLVDFAAARADRSDFFRSLCESLKRYGSWTPNQLAAVQRIYDEHCAKTAPAAQATGNSMSVPTLFDVLQRHTTFHAGQLKISRKNQDTLCWLVWNDVTVGKIEDGRAIVFRKAGDAAEQIMSLLAEFEANPIAAAMKYGKLSGRCCSCGRDLTDPESIERGIGPVCAEKFNI